MVLLRAMRRRTTGVLLAIAMLSGACDSPDPAKTDKKAEPEPRAAAPDEALAKHKAEREQAERDEQEAKAKLAAQIDALAVIPAQLPKKLDKACEAMLASYDGFMRKTLQGDMLTKWETGGNEMQLAVFRKECLKRDIATAACQAHALAEAPAELADHLADIMTACNEKATAEAAAAP